MTTALQNFNKTFITLSIGLLFSISSYAACPPHLEKIFCDLCGCTTSSGSSGFGTLNDVSFIGLRYIHQSYESRDGIFVNSPTSEENFNTYQIWSKVPLSKKFSINAMVPFQDLSRKRNTGSEHISGLGDVTVIGWYQHVFYEKPEGYKVIFENKVPTGHQLNFGLGVKLPTGEFEEELTDRINPGFQVGTGSVDVLASISHSYSKNKLGINTLATYYFKTENKNEYRFGNQFSVSSNAYYNIPFTKSALSPFLGLSADVYDSIEQFDEQLVDTDGYIFNGSIGTEYKFDQFVLGASYTLPIVQDLFGGDVESQNKFLLYANFVLN
ncbi:hypothetical protein [Nonlabens sp.]|uniref:hypothetical protein n=1 Tax=Nonlabens sp. TaxID=1888209 RepID=UPI003266D8DA